MDRYRLISTFNGVPPQKPSFLPNAPSQISLPAKPHFQEPHIFTYLRPESEELTGDSLGQTTDDTEISIFDAERYFNDSQDSNSTSTKLTAINPEIQNCKLSPNPLDSSFSSIDGFSRNFRSRSFRTTPTASSEASWNSQAGLLRKSQASLSVSVSNFPNGEQRKEPSSAARRLFGHACPCSCKKSVDVEETYSEPKSANPSNYVTNNSPVAKASSLKAEQVMRTKEGVEQMTKMKVFPGILPQDPAIFRAPGRCFSLENPYPALEIGRRISDSGGFSFPAVVPRKEDSAEDPPRVSLEVFRPTETATPLRNSAEFQKIPFLINTGDRRNFTFSGSPKTRPAVEDDVASDTSSDLFEIESLSTQMGIRRRDSLEELSSSFFEPRKLAGSAAGVTRHHRGVDDEEAATPSITPSECYPPSEVSVEWSVTTAEGFDRSSVANFSSAVSEYEKLRYAAVALGSGRKKDVNGAGAASAGLLSCRSEKAVCIVRPNSEWFEPELPRRLGNSVASVGLDRVMGVARLGGGNPVHDGSGPIGLRSRTRFV
ncbi:hypothetical protein M5K25_007237 [Dendrobium thyrsiflorum]|uniref:Protein PHYTOCHROME KINASE SUBSTRATE 4 n=1 Tax=Dendrobium thyrsiflorum TaxID=117978 RepID=A0ABD0VDE2_DENTH